MDESSELEHTLRSEMSSLKDDIIDQSTDILSTVNLPIFSYINESIKIFNSLTRNYEIKKIYMFLYELRKTTLEQRVHFLNKINENKKLCSDFSTLVICVIQKVDDIKKSNIIGFITKQMILGNIPHDCGIRAIKIIEKIIYEDLIYLSQHNVSDWITNQELIDSISGLGLLTSLQMVYLSETEFPIKYTVNNFGMEFKKIIDDFFTY